MKIGLLTYFGDLNPGTNLQCYTLYNSIKNYFPDDDVEVINYHSFRRLNRPFLSSLSPIGIKNDLVRIKKYRRFRNEHFRYSKPHLVTNSLSTAKEYIIAKQYDLIFVGSDTLLELHYSDETGVTVFWLPEEIKSKKIMISASARDTQFEKLDYKQVQYLRESISGFKYVSVRDDSTLRLINKLNPEILTTKTPDPTFFMKIEYSYVNEYLKRKKIDVNEKIICVHLTRTDKWLKEFKKIANKNNYKIASLRPSYNADYLLNDMSPLEYAGIFKFFSCVITTRFHDSVFSFKNLTPLITILPGKNYENEYGESKYSSLLKDFLAYDDSFINTSENLDPSLLFEKMESIILNFKPNFIQSKLEIMSERFYNAFEESVE